MSAAVAIDALKVEGKGLDSVLDDWNGISSPVILRKI